jgi:hypothetical protein
MDIAKLFSDMEAIYSDPKSNFTGQDLMQAKMSVKSAVKGQEKYCGRCIEAEKERKEVKGRRCQEEAVFTLPLWIS